MARFKAIGFGLLALVVLPGAASAMTAQQQADFKKNCTGDYVRLCADYEPDAPQTQQCFQQKIRQVSARCRATIQTFQRGG